MIQIFFGKRLYGALVAFFTEEIADITWIESFQLIMLLFKDLLVDEMDMDSYDALL